MLATCERHMGVNMSTWQADYRRYLTTVPTAELVELQRRMLAVDNPTEDQRNLEGWVTWELCQRKGGMLPPGL